MFQLQSNFAACLAFHLQIPQDLAAEFVCKVLHTRSTDHHHHQHRRHCVESEFSAAFLHIIHTRVLGARVRVHVYARGDNDGQSRRCDATTVNNSHVQQQQIVSNIAFF